MLMQYLGTTIGYFHVLKMGRDAVAFAACNVIPEDGSALVG